MHNEPRHPLADRILERIEISNVTPRSRAYFLVRNAALWLLAGGSLIVGALATASIIFRAVNAPAVLRPGTLPARDLFLIAPFLWIALLALFGYLAYREVRSTRRGYRYELSTLVLALTLASVLLGVAFYVTGAGFALDRFAARTLPFHADLGELQRTRWHSPEHGFLIGEVTGSGEETFKLTDPAGTVWQVTPDARVPEELLATLEAGERVGVRGFVQDGEEYAFHACALRSLEFSGTRPPLMRAPKEPLRHLGERNLPPERSTGCEGYDLSTH